MGDLAKHAKTALTAYRDRGRRALARVEAGELDEAAELLRLRRAAFLNFRAVDALALDRGVDLGADEEAQALWREIRADDAELEARLTAAREETAALYQKIRETRAAIGAFRSKRADVSQFEKTA